MKHNLIWHVTVRARRWLLFAPILLALTMLLSPMQAAQAAPKGAIIVTALDDVSATNCTLRDAITAANNDAAAGACSAGIGADIIVFKVSGTITLTDILPEVRQVLTIYGPANGITISGNDSYPVFYMQGEFTTLNLHNLTITHANSFQGAGVFNEGGTVNISGSTFSDNFACYGGAIASLAYERGAHTSVSNSRFFNNIAACEEDAGSGAIFANASALDVSNSTFSENSASPFGSAIYVEQSGASIDSSTFSGNSTVTSLTGPLARRTVKPSPNRSARMPRAPRQPLQYVPSGGAIASFYSALNINSSTFSTNNGIFGGALYTEYSSVAVMYTTLDSNSAIYAGGAICSLRDLVVMQSTFSRNGAILGGGLYQEGGNVTVSNSTFSGNSAISEPLASTLNKLYSARRPAQDGVNGGAIFLDSGAITVTNSTLAGNSA